MSGILSQIAAEPNFVQLAIAAVIGGISGLGIGSWYATRPDVMSGAAITDDAISEDNLRNRNWGDLLPMLSSLVTTGDSNKIYEAVAHTVNVQLESSLTAILWRKDGEFIFLAGEGLCDHSQKELVVPATASLVSYLYAKNCPVMLATGDRQLCLFDKMREPVRDALIMPLRIDKTLMGMVIAFNKRKGKFEHSDLDMSTYLMVPFTLAINNAVQVRLARKMTLGVLCDFVACAEENRVSLRGHSERVARLADMIAAERQLDATERENLQIAARLHDLGKLLIPDELYFADSLTDDYDKLLLIQDKLAAEIVKTLGFVRGALPYIVNCRERYDGSGTPSSLRGSAIPEGAMILAVAETYDLITHDIPGRAAMSASESRAYMESMADKQFDGQIIRSFLKVLDRALAN